jgi:hypothetical protein
LRPEAAGIAPGRLLLALLLCVAGIAVLDLAVDLLRQQRLAMRPPDLTPAESFDHFRRASRWGWWLERGGLSLLWLLALLLAFPRGLVRDEYPTLLAFLIAFTIGRSFFGWGEGFSTDFLWLNLICGGVALVVHDLVSRRS